MALGRRWRCTSHHGAGARARVRRRTGAISPHVLASVSSGKHPESDVLLSGSSAVEDTGAPSPLIPHGLSSEKEVYILRHGESTFNLEDRIQGSSNASVLTERGREQARLAGSSIRNIAFDACVSSPLNRAWEFAEIAWARAGSRLDSNGSASSVQYSSNVQEAHLPLLEGLTNTEAAETYPEKYEIWRTRPELYSIGDPPSFPVVEQWVKARAAWAELLSGKARRLLVVTHKSIARALVCAALGLGPDAFRSVDLYNGSFVTFRFSTNGEPLLTSLNASAHLKPGGEAVVY